MGLGAGEAVFAIQLAGQRSIGPEAPAEWRLPLARRARKNLPKVTAASFTINDPGVKASAKFRPLKDGCGNGWK